MSSSGFNIINLIRKKRDKEEISVEEMEYLIQSYTDGSIADYQMSAFLMAAYLNGLNEKESSALCASMLHSGIIVDLSEVPGIKVDKHSTGGVGDKTSLILAPIVASAGVPVPMISGRGLGHTGGTLDKLQSIHGFQVDQDLERYVEILKKQNLVLIGQTKEIAPADKKIYALRDVTSTVEYIPFIAGSIMSKKIAEGIDALVLDVKYGSGAFMKTQEKAIELAETLVSIGESFGKHTIAFITNMEEPLGRAIGNWFEVEESIQILKGEGDKNLSELTHLLAGTMIYLGGKADSIEKGIKKSHHQVQSGEALQKFKDIVKEQGGDVSLIENPESYPKAAYQEEIKASESGYITKMDALKFGLASVALGAGRKQMSDELDYQAGIMLHKKVGDFVNAGETIFTYHTNTISVLSSAKTMLEEAVEINEKQPKPELLISHVIDRQGLRAFEL